MNLINKVDSAGSIQTSSRRRFLSAIAAVVLFPIFLRKGNAAISDAGMCIVRPEQTEGPYYVDKQLNRVDVRTEPSTGKLSAGVPLALNLRVSQTTKGLCEPLPGAIVNIWHCDAQGVYSGVKDGIAGYDTSGKKFLRGYQITDAAGQVSFITIFPGWYPGRAVHIHFKINTVTADGRSYEFTSQLYFDPTVLAIVYEHPAYQRSGFQDTTNDTDMHFRQGGRTLLLSVEPRDGGFVADFDVALDLSDAVVGRPDGFPFGDMPST